MHTNENNNACNKRMQPPLQDKTRCPAASTRAYASGTLTSAAAKPWVFGSIIAEITCAAANSLSSRTHSADRRLTHVATVTNFAARAFVAQLINV